MQTREYRTCDKSEWGPGPWHDEPDKVQWQDPATGLPCLIVRNTHSTGALCGYVGVTEGHPDFGKGYGSVEADVHGGLTFADRCSPHDDEARGICHVPDAGEPDHLWWLGFDCSHGGDLCPIPLAGRSIFFEGDTYKPIEYVRGEVESLASQLHARRRQDWSTNPLSKQQ